MAKNMKEVVEMWFNDHKAEQKHRVERLDKMTNWSAVTRFKDYVDMNHQILDVIERWQNDDTGDKQCIIPDVSKCSPVEYALYRSNQQLREQIKKLEFMIKHGLGEEDMRNDISYPNDIL